MTIYLRISKFNHIFLQTYFLKKERRKRGARAPIGKLANVYHGRKCKSWSRAWSSKRETYNAVPLWPYVPQREREEGRSMLRPVFRSRWAFHSQFSFLLLTRSQAWGLEWAALPRTRSGFQGKEPGVWHWLHCCHGHPKSEAAAPDQNAGWLPSTWVLKSEPSTSTGTHSGNEKRWSQTLLFPDIPAAPVFLSLKEM